MMLTKKRILLLVNNDIVLYKFRKELLSELVKNYEVYIALPNGRYIQRLRDLDCRCIETPVDRRGTKPITDFKLIQNYKKIINKILPDIVLTYTIKPNIYGGIACRALRVPYITNVTGLGTSIENKGLIQKIALGLYRIGLRQASCVFFQNEPNRKFFIDRQIVTGNTRLIPGSGVNLEQYSFEEYPDNDDAVKFLFIGRIMKDKGVEELLDAAIHVKAKYPNVRFEILGDIVDNYSKNLKELEERGIIKYHGYQDDVHSFIKRSHATVLPSYHEGIANVLLESASSGRPLLASRVAGCRETFDDGVTGLGFEVKSSDDLIDKLIKFIELPYEHKKSMGVASRKKMEREFDRRIVVDAYLEEIERVIGK